MQKELLLKSSDYSTVKFYAEASGTSFLWLFLVKRMKNIIFSRSIYTFGWVIFEIISQTFFIGVCLFSRKNTIIHIFEDFHKLSHSFQQLEVVKSQ